MSRNNQSRNNQLFSKDNGRTPHCKVCMDAGKSRIEYESHYVKTREGVVCCPTLLSQQCRYCKLTGKAGNHTVKYCPTLLKQQSEKNYAEKCSQDQKNANKSSKKTALSNAFAAAFSDSDTESETDKSSSRPASPLSDPPSNIITSASYNLWSKFNKNTTNDCIPSSPEVVAAPISNYSVENMRSFHKKRITNWADCNSDSDEE